MSDAIALVGRAPHGLDLDGAADALLDWGFLAQPGAPLGPAPGYLLVALRNRPTLHHYDPEAVHYWVTQAGRGERAVLDRWTPMPLACEVAWGTIRIVDRIGASNEFLTFGGSLSADRGERTTVAVFISPSPLLRRGGHSQGWDPGAQELAGHFARLVAAAGEDRDFEADLARTDPQTRYAAFLADQVRRCRQSELIRQQKPALWQLFLAEEQRIRRADPERWRAGLSLCARSSRAVAA